MSPPVIVIIPGCWYRPVHFKDFEGLLSTRYKVVTAHLPCIGAVDPASVTLLDDIKHIREQVLEPLLARGEDVVILGHSYGGIPAAAAVKGLGPLWPAHVHSDRMNGANGAIKTSRGVVLGLVFLTSFLINEGYFMRKFLQRNMSDAPSHCIAFSKDCKYTYLVDPRDFIFEDVIPSVADAAIAHLATHALGATSTPTPYAAWQHPEWKGRCAYIATLHDKAIPYEVQQMMMENSDVPCVATMDTGHSAYLARPEDCRDAVWKCVKKFSALP